MIARSEEVLEDCLRQSAVDTIVQEYVGGAEFGVFYYRRPSESQGHIFSITEKRLPTVVGDGRRTLEELILHDDRAVCAADCIATAIVTNCRTCPLKANRSPSRTSARTAAVPCSSTAIGSLPGSRGSIRRDCQRLRRFLFRTIRCAAGESTRWRDRGVSRGHGFKILELNGVTSEATHIYHPGTPLTTAYRVLMQQWRIAFEIGEENHRPAPL